VSRAVVPVENTQSGTFQQTLTALFSSGLSVVGEHVSADRHVLCALPGTKLDGCVG
jgi:prephenate dehydratase